MEMSYVISGSYIKGLSHPSQRQEHIVHTIFYDPEIESILVWMDKGYFIFSCDQFIYVVNQKES